MPLCVRSIFGATAWPTIGFIKESGLRRNSARTGNTLKRSIVKCGPYLWVKLYVKSAVMCVQPGWPSAKGWGLHPCMRARASIKTMIRVCKSNKAAHNRGLHPCSKEPKPWICAHRIHARRERLHTERSALKHGER